MADSWPAIGLSLSPSQAKETPYKVNSGGGLSWTGPEAPAVKQGLDESLSAEPTSDDLYRVLFNAALEARDLAEQLMTKAETLQRDSVGRNGGSADDASITLRMLILESEADRIVREAIHRLENCRSYLLLQSTKRSVLAPGLRAKQGFLAMEGGREGYRRHKGPSAEPEAAPASRTANAPQLPNLNVELTGRGQQQDAPADSLTESASQIPGTPQERTPGFSSPVDSGPHQARLGTPRAEFQFLSNQARPEGHADGSLEGGPGSDKGRAGSPQPLLPPAHRPWGADGLVAGDTHQGIQSRGSSPEGSPRFHFVPHASLPSSNAPTPSLFPETREAGAQAERPAWPGLDRVQANGNKGQVALSWPSRDAAARAKDAERSSPKETGRFKTEASPAPATQPATQGVSHWRQSPPRRQKSGEYLGSAEEKSKANLGEDVSPGKTSSHKTSVQASGVSQGQSLHRENSTSSTGISAQGGLLQQYMQKGRLKLGTPGEAAAAASEGQAGKADAPTEANDSPDVSARSRSPTLGPASSPHHHRFYPRDHSVNKPAEGNGDRQSTEHPEVSGAAVAQAGFLSGSDPARSGNVSPGGEAALGQDVPPSDGDSLEHSDGPPVGSRPPSGPPRLSGSKGAGLGSQTGRPTELQRLAGGEKRHREGGQAAEVDEGRGGGADAGASASRQLPPKRKRMQRRVVVADSVEDGWNWRKYGQKETMHNAYPRSYYRCKERCGAKKQVERCTDDPSKVRITYESEHSHEKPVPRSSSFITMADEYRNSMSAPSPGPGAANLANAKSAPVMSSAPSSVLGSPLPSLPDAAETSVSPTEGDELEEQPGGQTSSHVLGLSSQSSIDKGGGAFSSASQRGALFRHPTVPSSGAAAPSPGFDLPTVQIPLPKGFNPPNTGKRAGPSIFAPAGGVSPGGSSAEARSKLKPLSSPLFPTLGRAFGEIFKPEARKASEVSKAAVTGTFGDIYRQIARQGQDRSSPPPLLTLGRNGAPLFAAPEHKHPAGASLGLVDSHEAGYRTGVEREATGWRGIARRDIENADEGGMQDMQEHRLTRRDSEEGERMSQREEAMQPMGMELSYGGTRDGGREASLGRYATSAEEGMDLDLGIGVGNSQASSPMVRRCPSNSYTISNPRAKSSSEPAHLPELEASSQSEPQSFRLGVAFAAPGTSTTEGSQSNGDEFDGSSPRIIIPRRPYRPPGKAQVWDDKISPTFVGCLESPLMTLSPVVTPNVQPS